LHKSYLIDNTSFLKNPEGYEDPNLFENFNKKLIHFKSDLLKNINKRTNVTYYKFGDGDYYFLKKIPRGSAKPGRRALKKSYNRIDHEKFVSGSLQNDYYMSLITPQHTQMFYEVFKKKPDYPSEFVYGLIANKWLIQNSSKKIGLIGADRKLELIFKLLETNQYQNYLGIESFTDYITIPQRFAVDNLQRNLRSIKKQIKGAESEIFLVGIGHAKSGILHKLKDYKSATFVDIGVGIDALAGVVNLSRPYFGSWVNHQFKNTNIYSEIDFLVNNNDYTKDNLILI
jgi:hypothetical protein